MDTSGIGAGGPSSANTTADQQSDANAAMAAANDLPVEDGSMAASNAPIADGQGGAPEDAAATAFNARFEQGTRESCVASAESRGGDPDRAEAYCACVVQHLRALSVQDKMQLPQHPETLEAAARACSDADQGGGDGE